LTGDLPKAALIQGSRANLLRTIPIQSLPALLGLAATPLHIVILEFKYNCFDIHTFPEYNFNMKNKIMLLCILGLLAAGTGPALLWAQSAASMDSILDQDMLSFGAASYLLLVAQGDIEDNADFAQAAELMVDTHPVFSDKDAEAALTLGEYSFLIMKIYDRSGGLLYRFFPGPRYAVRELSFIEAIQGSTYPDSPLTGKRAVRILERFLTLSQDGNTGGEV